MRPFACLMVLLCLAGCASRPQLVMLNPRTGVTVGCESPDPLAGSGEYLVSRACLSACQAHGFRPVPGAKATGGGGGMPQACLD
jgi:hypothetical protein